MRISDWSSDVCSSDLHEMAIRAGGYAATLVLIAGATLSGLLIAPRWGSGPVALLYIPPVLVAAAIRGPWPALAAAMVPTLAHKFLCNAPLSTYLTQHQADVVMVVGLLLVPVLIARTLA